MRWLPKEQAVMKSKPGTKVIDLTSFTLEELRQMRDDAARNRNMKLALECAIAIDKKKGFYK